VKKMMELLQKSAELGDSDALFALGDMYFHGVDGVDVDYPTALKYFTSAAKSGNADACVNQVKLSAVKCSY
jgi:TPR repeat protein